MCRCRDVVDGWGYVCVCGLCVWLGGGVGVNGGCVGGWWMCHITYEMETNRYFKLLREKTK